MQHLMSKEFFLPDNPKSQRGVEFLHPGALNLHIEPYPAATCCRSHFTHGRDEG